jgi:hypothetical protein
VTAIPLAETGKQGKSTKSSKKIQITGHNWSQGLSLEGKTKREKLKPVDTQRV